MIQSYQETPVLLASNSSPLTFSTDCIRTRCANCNGFLQHSQGSPLYKILNGGNYDVTFNANVKMAESYGSGYVYTGKDGKKKNRITIEEFSGLSCGQLHSCKMAIEG